MDVDAAPMVIATVVPSASFAMLLPKGVSVAPAVGTNETPVPGSVTRSLSLKSICRDDAAGVVEPVVPVVAWAPQPKAKSETSTRSSLMVVAPLRRAG